MTRFVEVQQTDAVATVTLSDPEQRNAWSRSMERDYFEVLDHLDADPATRAIVITGAGSWFCPGMGTRDLADTASGDDMGFRTRRPQSDARRVRKPMIAAINGACAGIGLYQALMCDVRFVSRSARLSTAYARRGLPAEYGMSWLLPRLLGVEVALDLLISGRVIDGEEAHRLGLAARLAEPDEVVSDARTYAADLAANCSPRSMAAIRRQVWGDLSRGFSDSVPHALALLDEFTDHGDFAEGIASFVEKRAPDFSPLSDEFRLLDDLGY